MRSTLAVPAPTTSGTLAPASTRLGSVDAYYRGLVMLLMMAEVLQLQKVSQAVPENSFWKFFTWHQSHVKWVGASLRDLIQPLFSFLVGVALPFSIASRTARGQSRARMTWHAWALLLGGATLHVLWLLLYWMYQQKLFLKV